MNVFRLGGAVAALRAGVYQRWAAVVTMVAPVLLPFVFALGAAVVVVGPRARSGQMRAAGREVR